LASIVAHLAGLLICLSTDPGTCHRTFRWNVPRA